MKSRYTKIFMVIVAVFTMLLALFATPNRALAEEVDTVAYDYSVIENSIPDEAIVSFPVVTESVYGNAISWSVQGNQSVIEYDSEAGWMIVHRENAANENPDPEDPTFKGSIVTLNVTIAGEAKVLKVKVPYGTTNVPSYSIAYKELVGEELVDATPEGAKTQFKLGEKTFTLPEPEERTGYTFEGWYVGEQKVTKVLCGTMNDVEVVAKWAAKEYTLTINVDGQITTKTYAYGATIEEIAEPTKEGHEFTGWGREVPATMPAGDVELVAQWTANTYKVVFDVDGVKQEKTFTYGTAIVAPADPEKEGYTFSGWEPALPENMPAQDLEVSATWTTNKYTLTFLLDDGSEYLVVNQDYASELTIEKPTKTGYSFDGWDLQVEGEYDGVADQLPGTMPAENRTYKAVFTANEGINVVFNTQGGNDLASMSGDFDEVIQLPLANEVTKEGNTFKEWNTSADGKGTSYAGGADFKINSETTITLYAIWAVNSYELTLNLDGVEQSKTYEFGATVDAYPTPTKPGYVFMGWRTEPNGEVVYTPGQEPATMPAYDLTLYIYWLAQNYTVTFESNGGSEVAAITQAYKSEVAEPAAPTKAGYTFGGWYTDQELENAATFPYEMPLNGATLYAKWNIVEYTITYADAKGFYTDSVKYTVEDTPVSLPAPQQAGYEFDGWYDAQDKLVESIAQGATGDVTLNAKWNLVTYDITYTGLENANAPEGNPATYTVESDAITLLNPTKSGYKFLGWFNGENQVEVIAEGSTGDLTLEAKWEKGDLLKKAEEDAEAIKELYQDALAGTTITEALEDALVLVGPVHGLKVQWKTSNSAASVSNEDGLMTVVRSPEKDMIVTLTATIKYTDVDNPEQSYSAATSFTFTVAQYVTYSKTQGDVTVSNMEQDLTLTATEYGSASEVANFELLANEQFVSAYDITLKDGETVVSSFAKGVTVRIHLGETEYKAEELAVYHMDGETKEPITEFTVGQDANGYYVEFVASEFSPYVVVKIVEVSEPEITTVTITKTIAEIASENNYSSQTKYLTINLDSVITLIASSNNGSNTGKYYSTGVGTWRFYSSESAKLTIKASEGYVIKTVTLTYTEGLFTGFDSDTEVEINLSSIEIIAAEKTFLSAISVVYSNIVNDLDHTHSYDSSHNCICGEVDPNPSHDYDETHTCACGKVEENPTHIYDQKTYRCACGELNPEHTTHVYDENGKCACGAVNPNSALSNATLSFADTSARISQTTTSQVWKHDGITLTNNKASSNSNVIDSSNPVRLYANSEVIIEGAGMTEIVVNCNTAGYATALGNSISNDANITVTVSSKTVTIVFKNAVDSFTISSLSAQVRVDSITVNPA